MGSIYRMRAERLATRPALARAAGPAMSLQATAIDALSAQHSTREPAMETEVLVSPISVGGLLGQLPFLLLIVAMFPSQIHRLRLLILIAALLGLVHALIWSGNIVLGIWWALLLAVTLLVV